MIQLEEIRIYPIKSTAPIYVEQADVLSYSIAHDRTWAIFNEDNQALTARDYPQLLDLKTSIHQEHLSISLRGESIAQIPLLSTGAAIDQLGIHSYTAPGIEIDTEFNLWLSNFLKVPCRLVQYNKEKKRPVLAKHGGVENDRVGFGDQAPILLLSQASLNDLNTRLETPIGMDRFRPNLIVSGLEAYEEDHLTQVQIGNTTLKIIQHCERCVLTTIDPISKEKHRGGEPLTTLSKYRKGPRGGIILGVHAVVIKEGTISKGDAVVKL